MEDEKVNTHGLHIYKVIFLMYDLHHLQKLLNNMSAK